MITMDIATTILYGILWTMGASVVGIGLFMFVMLSKYKHNVTIRMHTATGKFIKRTKAKELDGGKWKWLYQKKVVLAPPEECVDGDNKGKLHVDCYLSKDGEVSYRRDPWSFKEIPKDIMKLKHDNRGEYETKLQEWKDKNKVIESNPLTPKQKSELIKQEKKREEYKNDGFLGLVQKYVPLFMGLILVICLMVFYGSMGEPLIAMAGKMDGIQAKQLEIAETQLKITNALNSLIKEKQLINGDDILNELQNSEGDE